MAVEQAQRDGSALAEVQTRDLGGLVLVYPILQKLQVCRITNEVIRGAADIDLGRLVLLLTLNRLLSPKPLSQIGQWAETTILPELLEIKPEQVYDNRLGRGLDRLH